VKTFFDNSTTTMRFSIEFSTQSWDLPLMVVNGITKRGSGRNLHTRFIKAKLE
jgi:hypothetical protein